MMPRHEYRTIEEFVSWLDGQALFCRDMAQRTQKASTWNFAAWTYKASAFEEVAERVRNSNLGIVYPPGEKPECDCTGFQHRHDCPHHVMTL